MKRTDATRWADGTPRSTGNAFTAAPRATFSAEEKRAHVAANTKAARSVKQVLAAAKNGIAIGTLADADKRARIRRASI